MSSLEGYYILFATYDGNKNCHAADFVEHTGLFFCMIAYSRVDDIIFLSTLSSDGCLPFWFPH
jgi:hypothetical protein